MKKFLRLLLLVGLLLILIGASGRIYWAFLNRQRDEQAKLIDAVSDSMAAFTYDSPINEGNPYEAMVFEIPAERDVQFHVWAMSLLGKVKISAIDSNGATVFQTVAGRPNETYTVHLEAGQYRVMLHSSDSFGVAGVVGLNYQSYATDLLDTDSEGLPDDMEGSAGTDPNAADTDGDALSDYVETVKYRTDPLQADSDEDGLPDSDWSEKREYVYTARTLIRLREPFDLGTMNDLYQDVRIVAGPDEAGYTTLETIIYPDTHPILTASAYPSKALPEELQAYIQPGIATNYDSDMRAEVLDIVAGSTTDIQVAKRVVGWVRNETSFYLDTSIPEVYFTYRDDGKVKVRNYSDSLPVDELLRTHYFAASMFKEHTHGTCTSIATLKCAMLKAAGIPCRLIQTLFPIYYHGSQTEPYTNNLRRDWSGCSYEQSPGDEPISANHAFMEVYLGSQWVRVDEGFGIFQQGPRCLGLKILSVADWSEVDFSETWPVDWIHDRPYYTILIEDQEPQQ